MGGDEHRVYRPHHLDRNSLEPSIFIHYWLIVQIAFLQILLIVPGSIFWNYGEVYCYLSTCYSFDN